MGHLTDGDALADLVALTADGAPLIRDWACFGLFESGRDTPAVREALLARVADDDTVTRGEALRALAVLGDLRALQPLVDALDSLDGDDAPDAMVDAAERLAGLTGDARLAAYASLSR